MSKKTKFEIGFSVVITTLILLLLVVHGHFPLSTIFSSFALSFMMFVFFGTLIQDISEILLTSKVSNFSAFMSALLLYFVLYYLGFFMEHTKAWVEWLMGFISIIFIWVIVLTFETAILKKWLLTSEILQKEPENNA